MKIRIFKLAKELGLDHKELVEICGEVGVLVKSSPLASITAEQKDLVTEHLKSRSAPKPPEDDAAPLAPVREAGDGAANRIRSMRTMTARPTPRVRPKAVAEPDAPVEAVPETAGAEAADAAAAQAPESPTGTEGPYPRQHAPKCRAVPLRTDCPGHLTIAERKRGSLPPL